MIISELIDRNCGKISVLEDMQQIGSWLQNHDYYAVVDEGNQTIGIVTTRDFFFHPDQLVIDHDFSKPSVAPSETLESTVRLMLDCRSAHLPVYDAGLFVGVVSLFDIAIRLISA